MTYLIRDLPADVRPRERLLAHGAEALSDAELLAVILGTGAPGKNAIHLAQELLQEGMRDLRQRELTMLAATRGVGPAKAARISAVMEICRRLQCNDLRKTTFDASSLGANLVATYGHHTQERLGVAALDARHRVRKQREIFIGSADKAFVSTREITRFALIERATGVVVFHNHPSGDPTPSEDDVTFTQKLRDALKIADIELVDHLVIGDHRFLSMKTKGLF